jgi:hypothetical protein
VEIMVKITASIAETRLKDVPQDKRFWCHDGRYLKNLQELKAALEQMTDVTFRYHVNDLKSDFSIWVRDIFGDEKLSNDLKRSETAVQAAGKVAVRIDFLKKKIYN